MRINPLNFFSQPPLPQTAIIANGEMEIDPELVKKINLCQQKIAVDGGLNHCFTLGVIPDLVVGDFDSVTPEILKKYPTLRVVASERAKDLTDLEMALKEINISKVGQIRIFGGLGNRIDHTLTNLYLLLRFPAKIFLETVKEKVFAINSQTKDFELECHSDQILTMIPLYGSVENVSIIGETATYSFPLLDNEKTVFSSGPLGNKVKIKIGKGEVICILSKSPPSEKELEKLNTIHCSFKLDQPLVETLRILRHLCMNPYHLNVETDEEIVFAINKNFGKWTIPNVYKSKIVKGTTISYIPFNDAASVRVEGVKWHGKLALSKNFLGISNIALTPSFTTEVFDGNVLCIVNKNLIDHEMIELQDNTSTASLT